MHDRWRVAVDGAETSAVLERGAAQKCEALFVAAHGAGSDMNHRSMLQLSAALRSRGIDVLRFNFPYRERGARAPDRMPKLAACMKAVIQEARRRVASPRLIIGGRSMGGRVASMLAAEGFDCDGLLLLAYPLHPAGQPERLRDAHLPKIRLPVLCFNGTRDALCTRELMERSIASLGWEMRWLEGKDHAFAVTDELGAIAARWIAALPAQP